MASNDCKDQQILRERYRADLRVYIDTTAALDRASEKRFAAAYKRAERAKFAFEASRLALQKHMDEHGC
jgi:hypothetical protein